MQCYRKTDDGCEQEKLLSGGFIEMWAIAKTKKTTCWPHPLNDLSGFLTCECVFGSVGSFGVGFL